VYFTIFVSIFGKTHNMKKQFILYFSLIIVALASSCSKNLSVHKRRYSDGYYVSISDKKKTNKISAENTTQKSQIKVENVDYSANETNFNKIVEPNEQIQNNYFSDVKLNKASKPKHQSVSNSLPSVKDNEKESNAENIFVIPQKTKRNKHQRTTPFNGFFFDQSSNALYTVAGILAFVFTTVLFIFIISGIGLLSFSFPFLFPLLIIIGIILLIGVGVLVAINAS